MSEKKENFLQNFEYRAKEWETVFLEALSNTSFGEIYATAEKIQLSITQFKLAEGVTGPVRFYNNERKASFLLSQFQHGKEVKIGEYSSLMTHLDLTRGEPLKWVNEIDTSNFCCKFLTYIYVYIFSTANRHRKTERCE